MPFPTTDMEGHAHLARRADGALARAIEDRGTDFKQSAAWDDLKWTIVKSVLGMGNLRDGGLIIVGVAERDDAWDFEGIADDDLATFDADEIAAAFEKYISPAPRVDVVLHKRAGKTSLVFDVRPFEDTPFICRRNGPNGKGLEAAGIYWRAPGVPRTERVQRSEDMRELIQMAAEEEARRILEQRERTEPRSGAKPAPPTDERFDQELGEL